ncbi:hypothetical protein GCM10020366_70970 [Saccharopolyspora gregorii]|uniref:Acyl-CoA dehydrogenase/oxidase N-terminal domain-containing protein n=2 Tax=Saccharopolyspora gregorii TaxID=33914 RepID=A0ABP6S339_9PSEU
MADLGWLGVHIPEEHGGAGLGMTDLCLFLEETAYGRAPIGVSPPPSSPPPPTRSSARRSRSARSSKASCAAGRSDLHVRAGRRIRCVGALTCKAERRDGGWVVNGQKTWCSNAHLGRPRAAHRPHRVRRHQARGADPVRGAHRHPRPPDPGHRHHGRAQVNDLYFTDCFLPDDAVVGTVDQGWKQLMAGLNLER